MPLLWKYYKGVDRHNFADFLAYVAEHRADQNEPLTVLLDNHKSHVSVEGLRIAEQHNLKLEFLPVAASDMNSIERIFALLKSRLQLEMSKIPLRQLKDHTDQKHQDLIDKVINDFDSNEAKRVFISNFSSLERELNLSIEYEMTDAVNQNVGDYAQVTTD